MSNVLFIWHLGTLKWQGALQTGFADSKRAVDAAVGIQCAYRRLRSAAHSRKGRINVDNAPQEPLSGAGWCHHYFCNLNGSPEGGCYNPGLRQLGVLKVSPWHCAMKGNDLTSQRCVLVEFLWCQMQELYCVKVNEPRDWQDLCRDSADTRPQTLQGWEIWCDQKKTEASRRRRVPAVGKSPFPSAAVPPKRRFRVLEERKGKKSSTEGEESGLSISGFSIRTSTIK